MNSQREAFEKWFDTEFDPKFELFAEDKALHWLTWQAATERGAGEATVPMPTTVAQAKGMALVGTSWLEANAPEELKPTGGCVPEGLIDFAKRCLAASRDGCDCDGGDIHEWALECGLIEPYRATEPCGHDCVCAEVAGFPIECYRDSDLLATQQPPEQE